MESVNALYICPHKEHQMFGPETVRVRDECVMSECEHRCYCFYKSLTVPPERRTQYACLRLKNDLRNYPTQKPPEDCHYSFATSKSFRGTQMLYFGGDIRLS